MAHGGGPAGAAAAAQYVAAQAAAGFGVAAVGGAVPLTIPAEFAGATPAAADLQAVNIQHEHLIMTWRVPRRCAPFGNTRTRTLTHAHTHALSPFHQPDSFN